MKRLLDRARIRLGAAPAHMDAAAARAPANGGGLGSQCHQEAVGGAKARPMH